MLYRFGDYSQALETVARPHQRLYRPAQAKRLSIAPHDRFLRRRENHGNPDPHQKDARGSRTRHRRPLVLQRTKRLESLSQKDRYSPARKKDRLDQTASGVAKGTGFFFAQRIFGI